MRVKDGIGGLIHVHIHPAPCLRLAKALLKRKKHSCQKGRDEKTSQNEVMLALFLPLPLPLTL